MALVAQVEGFQLILPRASFVRVASLLHVAVPQHAAAKALKPHAAGAQHGIAPRAAIFLAHGVAS